MKRGLVLTLIGIALTAAAPESRKPQLFAAPGCPLTFEVPAGWKATVLPPNPEMEYPHSVCSVALWPWKWEQVLQEWEFELDELAIEVQVLRAPFDTAAQDVGLERRDGRWTMVRESPMPATPFKTRHAGGVRGSWTHRVFRKGVDGDQVLAEADFVLLGRDSLWVAATAYWDSPKRPVFESVVNSLRLKP